MYTPRPMVATTTVSDDGSYESPPTRTSGSCEQPPRRAHLVIEGWPSATCEAARSNVPLGQVG